MECNMDENLLYEYEDGTIGQLEKIIVEEHLKHCSKCASELVAIRQIENSLKFIEKDSHVPENLSIISELVAQNCINKIENKNSKIKLHNYRKSFKEIGSIIVKSQFAMNNNPYNKFINNQVSKAVKTVQKPIGKYIKSKVSKLNPFKMLKAG